jgi:hypothetical protein
MFNVSPHQKTTGLAVLSLNYLLIINEFCERSAAYQLLIESHFYQKLQVLLMPLADPGTGFSRHGRKICQANA